MAYKRLALFLSLMSGIFGPAYAGGPTLNGLELWLKADAGLATDGSSWADQSGFNHNATALPGQAPSVIDGALNGLPVAMFSGGQALTLNGTLLNSQHFTIIAVVTDTGLSHDGFRNIISNWDVSTQGSSIFLGTVTSTVSKKNATPRDRIRFTDWLGGAADPARPEEGESRVLRPTAPFVLGGISETNNAEIYVQGKRRFALGTALPQRDLSEPWAIGRQGVSNNGEYWSGYIAEILVYNKALSKGSFNYNVQYLRKKWGIGK